MTRSNVAHEVLLPAAIVAFAFATMPRCGGRSGDYHADETHASSAESGSSGSGQEAPRTEDRPTDPATGLPVFGTYAPAPMPPPGTTAPPAPAPVVAVPAPGSIVVDDALVAQLASCWFASPYDYMFGSWSGASVTISGKSYGSFDAGIFGMLYYSDLNTCVGKVTGVPPKNYSDPEPFAALAGLPIYGPQASASKPFGYYNPDLVRWGHEHLVPSTTSTIYGLTAKAVYSAVFSRFFRMMAESYLWLANSGKYAAEMDAYSKMPYKTDGVDWLQNRYSGQLSHYGGSWDGTTMTPQMAIGFWLRRGIDGTSTELWTGLKKVLTRFDADWYAGLSKTYTSKDIVW